ncbi:MAG: hypothetical protein SOX97_05765 [Sutterella sp.]|nr:hypothetical protein [Sutterella sp.]
MPEDAEMDIAGKSTEPPAPQRRNKRKYNDKQNKNTDYPTHKMMQVQT